MNLREAEYVALRQTISARGTARAALFVAAVSVWGALTLLLLLYGELPIEALVPLAVLAAGFEAVHALHVGVERIGRYLQVYYEGGPDAPQWETTAMAFGPPLPGGGIDPLFGVAFGCCTVLNLIPAVLSDPDRLEFGVIATFHLAFIVRVLSARLAAARQRGVDRDRFLAIKVSGDTAPGT